MNNTAGDPHRAVRLWLYGLAALVAIMILVGGATRLTDSGLSITEWAPVSGVIPPLSQADWLVEFEKYQTTTEFKTINSAMTLDEFKFIFWWEWGHRFLGRLIGLVAILPLAFFWLAGRLPSHLKWPLVGLVALGGMQGAVGWWMVKSGLTLRVDVSQVRLAIHLTLACIILVATLWLARALVRHSEAGRSDFFRHGCVLVVLILAQIFMGGIVAGLDAGMAYNTWPLMDGVFVPSGLLAAEPAWLNLTDNAKTAQFVHRCSAYLLWLLVFVHMIMVLGRAPSTTHARRAVFLFILVTAQALSGILTLVLQVPIGWALVHQGGAVLVLGFATAHWRALKPAEISAFPAPAGSLNAVHVDARSPVS